MSVPAVSQPPALRWVVAGILLFVVALFISLLLSGPNVPAASLHTLGLLLVALSSYAWVLYPLAGNVLVSAAVLVVLVWTWAARQTPTLKLETVAFGILLVLAAWQRATRMRRLQRMQQLLDDLKEEQTVKDQAAALANQTHDALKKKLARYTQLQTIAEELSNITDLSAIGRLAVERIFTLMDKSDVCLLFLVDPERQELSLFSSKKRESLPTIRAKHGDQFDRYVLRTHRPLLVNDVRRDFRFTVTMSPEREIGAVIACPLLLGQRPEGVLRLDSARPSAYTQDDLRLLDILLDLLATAVTNAKLFARTQQLAITDGLTGLMLRRPFLEELGRELTRAARSREPVSVLMLDVDRFKEYNDTFGHTAGDLLLKGVAGVLREVVPPGGVSGRYGGEEFVVLLPRWSRHRASELAEQVRQRMERRVLGHGRGTARAADQVSRAAAGVEQRPVTVSIGVAACPDDAQAELELIRIADQRLYQAKHAGRNLVVSS